MLTHLFVVVAQVAWHVSRLKSFVSCIDDPQVNYHTVHAQRLLSTHSSRSEIHINSCSITYTLIGMYVYPFADLHIHICITLTASLGVAFVSATTASVGDRNTLGGGCVLLV